MGKVDLVVYGVQDAQKIPADRAPPVQNPAARTLVAYLRATVIYDVFNDFGAKPLVRYEAVRKLVVHTFTAVAAQTTYD